MIAFGELLGHRLMKKKMREPRPSMGRKTAQNPQVSHALTDQKAHRLCTRTDSMRATFITTALEQAPAQRCAKSRRPSRPRHHQAL